ncbi:MAG: 1,4-alpha-glucan branching enzyme, partial [Actinobacteria bacterium]|nr:1,4-alpha-glucan branching enzyme [Actinomycetota bacterium]
MTPPAPTEPPTRAAAGTGTSPRPVPREELDQLVRGEHGHPHAVLGPHVHEGAVTVRALKPLAARVAVVGEFGEVPLTHEHEGVWVGVLPVAEVPDYRLSVAYDGDPLLLEDPFRFLPTLGEVDLHLVNEGRHEQLWTALGAHVRHYEGADGRAIEGTSFAVWAPSARGVRLKCDANGWDGREHPMRQLGTSGVWELFVPGVGSGTAYKFAILGQDGHWR